MDEIEFPKIDGQVRHVAPAYYSNIISDYVSTVSKLPGVRSIIQFGAVSTPGVSDVDILVVVEENAPLPAWAQLSLQRRAKQLPHNEVVHHDVFVVPESIANQIDTFFLVLDQEALSGDRLVHHFNGERAVVLRRLIVLDYMIHRLESLMTMLTQPTLDLRSLLLFVNSVRISLVQAAKLGALPRADADSFAADVKAIREMSLERPISNGEFVGWPTRMIQLLVTAAHDIASKVAPQGAEFESRIWHGSARVSFIDVEVNDAVFAWRDVLRVLRRSRLRHRVRVVPVPSSVRRHMAAYMGTESPYHDLLRSEFPTIGWLDDSEALRSECRAYRVNSVCKHWEFCRTAAYMQSSGKGYIGVSAPIPMNWRRRVLALGRNLYARRIMRNLRRAST